jgi:hypothetical protein
MVRPHRSRTDVRGAPLPVDRRDGGHGPGQACGLELPRRGTVRRAVMVGNEVRQYVEVAGGWSRWLGLLYFCAVPDFCAVPVY